MKKIINPYIFFLTIQVTPLLVWFIVPSSIFEISLNYYDKPQFGLNSFLVYFSFLLAFFLGCKISLLRKRRIAVIKEDDMKPILYLHKITLLLSFVSMLFILRFSFDGNLNVIEAILFGETNTLREYVYSRGALEQIIIMGRHLLFTSAITWYILNTSKVKIKTLPVIILIGFILFLFTSSRFTLLSIILIVMVFKLQKPLINFNKVKLFIIVASLFFVFGLGVYFRSRNTWALWTGSDNIFIIAFSEFIGYFISPINYSVALIEKQQYFYPKNIISSLFGFIVTALNLNIGPNSYLQNISNYYNPLLSAHGLVGLWFTGFGPFLFIPSFLFGYISGKYYKLFINGNLYGMLFYPLIFISLFDSFRGFMLTQNYIMSNILFIVAFLFLWKLIKKINDYKTNN